MALSLGLGLGLAACSTDDDHRDQWYGTDVGANYQPPPPADAGSDTSPGGATDGALETAPEAVGSDGAGDGAPADLLLPDSAGPADVQGGADLAAG